MYFFLQWVTAFPGFLFSFSLPVSTGTQNNKCIGQHERKEKRVAVFIH